MPVIQQFDPLSAASDAVGAYQDKKRQNDLDAQAAAYTKARDARKDMESDRTYGLQKGEADDSHQKTLSDLQTEQQQRDVTAAEEAYNAQLRPITLQLQQLQIKKTQGDILTQKEQNQLLDLQRQGAAVDLAIQKRFGVATAAAALQKAVADGKVAQVQAQYAPAAAQASIRSTNASADASEADAYRTMHPVFAPRGDRSGPTADAAADAINNLSPKGQQFLAMLYPSGNDPTANPPTRVQAMVALEAARKNGMADSDYRNLKTVIESKSSQFVTPQGQISTARGDARTQTGNERYTAGENDKDFAQIAKSKAFRSLPPDTQNFMQDGVRAYGFQSALQHLRSFADGSVKGPIDQAHAQALLNALGG